MERAGARHDTMAEDSPLVTALMSAGALGTKDQIRYSYSVSESGMLGIFSSNSFSIPIFFCAKHESKMSYAMNANINFIHSFPSLPLPPFLNSNKERNIGHTCTLIYTEAVRSKVIESTRYDFKCVCH